jgi:hypothetical protein
VPERRRGTAPRWWIGLVLLLAPLAAVATPRIGLLTMAPGDEYWSRFGHNAILVEHPDGRATSYNYGYFDFDQDGFLLRFLRGRMLYKLVALPAERDLASYAAEGRGTVLQWLDLDPERARTLAGFLAWNALPENADYRYDYFNANCSTMVRDALDRALDGALRQQTSSPSRGLTARSESQRLAQTLPWLHYGIHFGLGPATDRPLSRWQEGFVPERLAEALRQVRLDDGRPLVVAEQQLIAHRLGPIPDEPPRTLPLFLALGLLLAGAFGWSLAQAPGALRSSAVAAVGAFWLFGGLLGGGLAALWLFTDHQAAWGNSNLFLLPPLLLALLPALPRLRRAEPVAPAFAILGLVVLASAVAGLSHTVLARNAQANGDWIALLLPLQAVLARTLWRLRR